MTTITLTPQPSNVPPRFQIDVAGVTGTTINITRTDPDGGTRPVRLAEPATLVAGAWTGYDYESPFDPSGVQRITYTVIPGDSSPIFSTQVAALRITQAWLIHPGVPGLSIPISGVDFTDIASDSGVTLHQVAGRENPVPYSDGRRKARTHQLIIRTDHLQSTAIRPLYPSTGLYPSPTLFPSSGSSGPATPATTADDVEALISDASTLLLQVVYPFTPAAVYEWIQVGHMNKHRLSRQFGDPRRVFTLDVTIVDRPAGGIAAERTYADVDAETGTYAALDAKYGTYHGLLAGVAGT
jgi:hypothetical protein